MIRLNRLRKAGLSPIRTGYGMCSGSGGGIRDTSIGRRGPRLYVRGNSRFRAAAWPPELNRRDGAFQKTTSETDSLSQSATLQTPAILALAIAAVAAEKRRRPTAGGRPPTGSFPRPGR